METNPSTALRTGVLYYGDNLDILPSGPSGRRYIPDDSIDLIYPDPPFNSQATYNVLFCEESGHTARLGAVSHGQIVLDREGEPIGVLLTLNPPTKEMIIGAAASGFYENDLWTKRYPRLQIITVLEVLNGKRPDMPWGGSPFAKPPSGHSLPRYACQFRNNPESNDQELPNEMPSRAYRPRRVPFTPSANAVRPLSS